MHGGRPKTQAEISSPLTAAVGGRVLVVAYDRWPAAQMMSDFAHACGLQIVDIGLDREHRRQMQLFFGEGYRPETQAAFSRGPTRP